MYFVLRASLVANPFRFTNASNPERCLVTEDPTFDTYLPVDDDAWDNGVRPEFFLLSNSQCHNADCCSVET